jgi:hypothetical protein
MILFRAVLVRFGVFQKTIVQQFVQQASIVYK